MGGAGLKDVGYPADRVVERHAEQLLGGSAEAGGQGVVACGQRRPLQRVADIGEADPVAADSTSTAGHQRAAKDRLGFPAGVDVLAVRDDERRGCGSVHPGSAAAGRPFAAIGIPGSEDLRPEIRDVGMELLQHQPAADARGPVDGDVLCFTGAGDLGPDDHRPAVVVVVEPDEAVDPPEPAGVTIIKVAWGAGRSSPRVLDRLPLPS